MYYLMDIRIRRRYLDDEKLQRLVKSKDKNEAYAKTEKYLKEVYISNISMNVGATYEITLNETIT